MYINYLLGSESFYFPLPGIHFVACKIVFSTVYAQNILLNKIAEILASNIATFHMQMSSLFDL